MHEFNKLHINMIRSIAPIIETKRKKINHVDTIFYYYNNELINENKELASLRQNNNNE